ncbi:MAG: glycogen/starch synthase, partial [Vicinamibacterales bacterium]|nr:glycogen/starch synthase [Vicinamibacterales bacterium]
MTPRDVLMVLSEAVPFSKTGGLGDVGGALPAALVRLGHRVTVVLPRYPGSPGETEVAAFAPGAWLGSPAVRLLDHAGAGGVTFRFVDCPEYYGREGAYGTA